jgi:hypothetical protein
MVREAARHGAWEHVLRGFCIHPFRCQLCDCRFLASRVGPGTDAHRDYERVLVRYPASFSATSAEAVPQGQARGSARESEGVIVNLSIRGCLMRSEVPLRRGAVLRLAFIPTEHQFSRPITIEQAVVRSGEEGTFGLEFRQVHEGDETHLREIIRSRLHHRVVPVS